VYVKTEMCGGHQQLLGWGGAGTVHSAANRYRTSGWGALVLMCYRRAADLPSHLACPTVAFPDPAQHLALPACRLTAGWTTLSPR